jgi:tRNA(Ile)-lysidine synthase
LLAVSGGADSVALVRAMKALEDSGKGRLSVAHLNHQLRGPESEADEAFVIGLCRGLQVPCRTTRADPHRFQSGGGDGLEAAARRLRYEFLRKTAEEIGARYVVTAHTADDQAETILHRILRGTGIAGLAGMARVRPLGPAVTLIRPMLGFRRTEVLEYLDRLGQPYRRDSSNEDLRFTRNRIRRQLLPQLAEQYNPDVIGALLRLGSLAAEAQSVVDEIVEKLVARSVSIESAGPVCIDTAALTGQPRYVIRELLIATWRRQNWPLQAMGLAEWNLLAEMIGTSKKRVFPGRVIAETTPDGLHLRGP